MFKTGVYNLEQLRAGKLFTVIGRRRRTSVRLLNQLEPGEEYEKLFDQVIRDVVDDRGAYKRTSSDRFAEFDSVAIDVLREINEASSPVFVHDAAVSNARTSVDFFDAVRSVFPDVDYLATDYDHELTVVSHNRLSVTLSSSGKVVEITWPPFVFTPSRQEHPVLYPLNRLIRAALGKTVVRRLVNRYHNGQIPAENVEKVELFSPVAQRLAASSPQFRLGTYNLLETPRFPHMFSCVRAMNVLNPTYFDVQQMAALLDGVASSLVEGGVFIAGSNQDAGTPVDGGIFKCVGGRFEALYETGRNEFLMEHMARFNSRSDQP